MDFGRKGFNTSRRLQKSHTQQHLHRKKGASKRQNLPTLEERNAGGLYGFINPKKKLDPVKAKIDYFVSS